MRRQTSSSSATPTAPPDPRRRGHRRFAVEGVTGNLRFTLNARVLNLSATGVALETYHWLKVGDSYPLRIRGRDGNPLTLTGTVAWCRLLRTEKSPEGEVLPVYDAGLSFEESFAPKGRELQAFIENHASVGIEGRRLTGRFQSRVEEALNVALGHHFVAREISRTEVLIEADLLPEPGSLFRIELTAGEHSLIATVRVVRVRQLRSREGRATSEIALRFVGLPEATVESLQQLIEQQVRESGGERAAEGVEGAEALESPYCGTESSKLFHREGCSRGPESGPRFASRQEALDAGFQPASCCEP